MKLEIDLQDLYGLRPRQTAATILKSILENYRVKILLILNLSPDSGLSYDIISTTYRSYIDPNIVDEIIKESESVEEITQKILEMLIERFNVVVVELFDGYEYAVAFVEPD